MSSCDHGRPKPRRAAGWAVLFALAASAMVSACTVQPLYGTAAGGGKVSATLARISIEAVDDRVAQQVRNNLIFDLAGGKEVSDPVYKMKLTVNTSQSELGLTHIEAAPTYTVTVTATYEVTKAGSDRGDRQGYGQGLGLVRPHEPGLRQCPRPHRRRESRRGRRRRQYPPPRRGCRGAGRLAGGLLQAWWKSSRPKPIASSRGPIPRFASSSFTARKASSPRGRRLSSRR